MHQNSNKIDNEKPYRNPTWEWWNDIVAYLSNYFGLLLNKQAEKEKKNIIKHGTVE